MPPHNLPLHILVIKVCCRSLCSSLRHCKHRRSRLFHWRVHSEPSGLEATNRDLTFGKRVREATALPIHPKDATHSALLRCTPITNLHRGFDLAVGQTPPFRRRAQHLVGRASSPSSSSRSSCARRGHMYKRLGSLGGPSLTILED